MERDIGSLKNELEDLDECIDKETVVDIIHEIVSSLIDKKGPKGCKSSSYSSKSFKDFDSIEIIEVRERKAVSHKQQRKAWSRKVKQFVI